MKNRKKTRKINNDKLIVKKVNGYLISSINHKKRSSHTAAIKQPVRLDL